MLFFIAECVRGSRAHIILVHEQEIVALKVSES